MTKVLFAILWRWGKGSSSTLQKWQSRTISTVIRVAQQGQPLFFEGINGQRPIRITEHWETFWILLRILLQNYFRTWNSPSSKGVWTFTHFSVFSRSHVIVNKAPSINIRTIVQYCPQLEILELGDNGDFVVAPLEEERQIRDFRYLKKLHICCRSEYFFVSKYESGYERFQGKLWICSSPLQSWSP